MNPYTDPPIVGIEAEETAQEIITDAVTGESVLAGETGSQVLVDEQGARHVRTVKRLVRGEGARVITDPTATYTCPCGNRLLTKESIGFCAWSQTPCCRVHLRTADDGLSVALVCPSCYENGKWVRAILRITRRMMRFITWLTRI